MFVALTPCPNNKQTPHKSIKFSTILCLECSMPYMLNQPNARNFSTRFAFGELYSRCKNQQAMKRKQHEMRFICYWFRLFYDSLDEPMKSINLTLIMDYELSTTCIGATQLCTCKCGFRMLKCIIDGDKECRHWLMQSHCRYKMLQHFTNNFIFMRQLFIFFILAQGNGCSTSVVAF